MEKSDRIKSSHKAIGSIIGGVFLVLIFTSMFTTYFVIENSKRGLDEVYLQRYEFEGNKQQEKVQFISVTKKANNFLNITVRNTGGVNTEIVYIGIIKRDNSQPSEEYLRIDKIINSLETAQDISSNNIRVSDKDTLEILFLTSYGNKYVYLYSEKNDRVPHNTGDCQDPSILLFEDFDDLTPGFDPPEWNDLDGTWSVEDDGTGNMVYYQQDLPDKEAISINVIGNETWVNYSYSVDVNFVQGQSSRTGRGALIIFHYSDANDYYYLFLKEDQDIVELHNHGDVAHLVASTSYSLSKNTWYNVNITIVDDFVNVTIDGNPCLTNIDMLLLHPGGSVGIGTSYYRVMFDNIIVKGI